MKQSDLFCDSINRSAVKTNKTTSNEYKKLSVFIATR